jgi:hypothetical protein
MAKQTPEGWSGFGASEDHKTYRESKYKGRLFRLHMLLNPGRPETFLEIDYKKILLSLYFLWGFPITLHSYSNISFLVVK